MSPLGILQSNVTTATSGRQTSKPTGHRLQKWLGRPLEPESTAMPPTVTTWGDLLSENIADVDGLPVSIQRAFHDQTTTGWALAARGFLSVSWVTAQRLLYPTSDNDKWFSQVHRAIFDAFLFIGERRNEEVHGAVSDQQQRQEAEVVTMIRNLFATQESLLPVDAAQMFPYSLDEILRKLRGFQRQWMRMAKRQVIGARLRAESTPTSQRLITCYFSHRSGLADDPP